MSKLTMEETGDLAPDSRAAVISELLNFMATKMEPVPYGTLLYHILHHFDCREEGRFNRSLQHPKHGGVYCDGKTEIRAVNAAEIILARATTGVAA
ncbi:hypothetical protein [Rhizobium sophoriradicis]|uniref:Uncharacterized protein n=1 Tax=Rhizobium sophoriradicis TaxID=1535245 RepID=A0A2A5KLJ5_9HYPH|nr:hypothetical protein [Rhizobium sophoriradicis]PCK77873.1 hypothetical protein CPT34_27805 [Rhizobium sophoriradicis]